MNHEKFSFTFRNSGLGKARLGTLRCAGGHVLETPAFLCCATVAGIKHLDPEASSPEAVFCNAFHLRREADVVAEAGGLRRWMLMDKPVWTDSGGYQIFSMAAPSASKTGEVKGKRPGAGSLVRISEEGALFKDFKDGSSVLWTPELSAETQYKLGADFPVILDECTPFGLSHEETEASLERTFRWTDRFLDIFQKKNNPNQALYGVLQGGVFPDLREFATREVLQRPFFGIAIGGSLGENSSDMASVVGHSVDMISKFSDRQHPVHLFGIGKTKDIFDLTPLGIDTFDCVYPTRLARHGSALLPGGSVSLRSKIFEKDFRPLDPDFDTGVRHSRSYVHHLIRRGEALGSALLTRHNVEQMKRLTRDARVALASEDAERAWKETRTFWIGSDS